MAASWGLARIGGGLSGVGRQIYRGWHAFSEGLRKPLPTFLGVFPTFPEFGRNFPVWGIFETSELSRKFLLISLKKTLCTIFLPVKKSAW